MLYSAHVMAAMFNWTPVACRLRTEIYEVDTWEKRNHSVVSIKTKMRGNRLLL